MLLGSLLADAGTLEQMPYSAEIKAWNEVQANGKEYTCAQQNDGEQGPDVVSVQRTN